MAGIVYTGVELNRVEMARIFTQLGDGGRWLRTVSAMMKAEAAAEAPKRSRQLSRSHYVTFRRGANQYTAVADIENRADHAEYVHGGTKGPIYGNPWMSLPAWGPHRAKVLRKVSGQAANPWLDRACSRVAMSQGAVRIL